MTGRRAAGRPGGARSGEISAGTAGDDRRLRDVVALSTLPAMWLHAEPVRIAESLAAALASTLRSEFVFVALDLGPDRTPAVATEGTDGFHKVVAERHAAAIRTWALQHDPHELMQVDDPAAGRDYWLTARPLGVHGDCGVIAAGFANASLPDRNVDVLMAVAATQATTAVQNARLLASLRDTVAERERSQAGERRAREESEILQQVAQSLTAQLDLEEVLQRATDAATRLSGAHFGAFFYNVVDNAGETYLLYTLSGAPRSAFEDFGAPRNTAIFEPTFRGEGIVRLDDVQADPRYGRNPPHHGMPKGHLPVRSYLAVPVISRSGEVLGGLFLGHPERGVFTDRAERLVAGVAAQTAIAVDNARLYGQAQREIEVRKQHQAHQKMLLDELNHRVKNTLALVQSIAMQTLKEGVLAAEGRRAYAARLAALAKVHDLLTEEAWEGADLRQVVLGSLAPYGLEDDERLAIEGPTLQLRPKVALTLGMAVHELATNAAKYGALSTVSGQLRVQWEIDGGKARRQLRLHWAEAGGPPVRPPARRGFGSMLIERSVAYDLNGTAELRFEPNGVTCTMELPLEAEGGAAA